MNRLAWLGLAGSVLVAVITAPRRASADVRAQLGGSVNVHIPTDPAADAFVAGGPRLAVSWVAPSGLEIGYIYSPLRPDLGLFIDHGLFAGWLWTRDRAVQPFARMSVSFACENHRDYYDQGHEYDTCSGPLALRAGGGVRLILQGPFAFTVEVVSGVALPSKVAGRAQLALGFDAIF